MDVKEYGGCCISFDSYIKPQRQRDKEVNSASCISFDSYIKPQLYVRTTIRKTCCISFDSYIKPQLVILLVCLAVVVYLLIPTSNHNILFLHSFLIRLYIF